MTVVDLDTPVECAACGWPCAFAREIGLALCRSCSTALINACLSKLRFVTIGHAAQAGARPHESYDCPFCLGLHIAVLRGNEAPMRPERRRRLDQVLDALDRLGVTGPRLNSNTFNRRDHAHA